MFDIFKSLKPKVQDKTGFGIRLHPVDQVEEQKATTLRAWISVLKKNKKNVTNSWWWISEIKEKTDFLTTI